MRIASSRLHSQGSRQNRYNHRDGNDDYAQAGDLFRMMSEEQKNILADNIAGGPWSDA